MHPLRSNAPSRRALTRAAREAPRPLGVFAIRCRASGLLVLRGSPDVEGAINRVRFELRLGGHRDRQVQAAWDAHGEAGLSFEIIELIKPRPDDPGFDPARELELSLRLWSAELLPSGAAS